MTDTPNPVRTAEDERADVVAYLKYALKFPFTGDLNPANVLEVLCDLIEQGKHEGWAGKETP